MLLASLLGLGALAACQGGALPVMDHDRDAGLTRDDFRAALAPRPAPPGPAEVIQGGPPIPELQPPVPLPPPLSPAERKLVSIAVDETVPLKDVLIELARKAEIDLELDPRIEGGVILTMRERPLREVIERIADLAGLRFDFHGTSLRIELDEPYYVNYRVDYLHLTRQANSRIETSVNVMSGDQGADGNASTSAVSGQSDVNFWLELEASLSQILANSRPRELTVMPAAALPSPAAGPQPGEGGASGAPGAAAVAPPNGGGAAEPTAQPPAQPPRPPPCRSRSRSPPRRQPPATPAAGRPRRSSRSTGRRASCRCSARAASTS